MKALKFFGALAIALALLCSCNKGEKEEGNAELLKFTHMGSFADFGEYGITLEGDAGTLVIALVNVESEQYAGGPIENVSEMQPKAAKFEFKGSGHALLGNGDCELMTWDSKKNDDFWIGDAVGTISLSYPKSGTISIKVDLKSEGTENRGGGVIKLDYTGTYSIYQRD